jgi:hypothetical protein
MKNFFEKGDKSGGAPFFILKAQEHTSSIVYHAWFVFPTVIQLHSTEAEM